MRHILLLITIAIFSATRANAQVCGSAFGAHVIQKISKRHNYVDGAMWVNTYEVFVDRTNPHACRVLVNGTEECHKLEGLKDVSSVSTIKGNATYRIIIGDKKVWSWTPTNPDTLNFIRNITMDTDGNMVQTTTDSTGRAFIGYSNTMVNPPISRVYKLENYMVTEAIRENEIYKITGIRFSSDYKNLFVVDALKEVIYKYDYNNNLGTLGKKEVVFAKKDYPEYQGYITTIALTKNNSIWFGTNHSSVIALYDYKNKNILKSFKIPTRNPRTIAYGGENMDILFVGTTKPKDVDIGGGYLYAISGTGMQGFPEGSLPNPKST